jgi:putative tricarboxylic transport membrane protein
MWNNEKVFSVFMFFIGVVGFYGSIHLPVSERFTLGPGAMPLIYSSGVVICAILIWVLAPSRKDASFKNVLGRPGRYGLIFLILNFVLGFIVYMVGFAIGLILFCFLALFFTKGWRPYRALLFSVAWSLAIYILFTIFLDVPFLKGAIFEK